MNFFLVCSVSKSFHLVFSKEIKLSSKNVFFDFYWIVNLDSLVLTYFYTIFLQAFIRFDLANICFIPFDTTLDYISNRYCCHTKHVKQQLKAVIYFTKKHHFICLIPIVTFFRESFNKVISFYFFQLDINFEIFFEQICRKNPEEEEDPNKVHGHDMISIRMIKICDTFICRPLKSIFQSCLESGSLPLNWKKLMWFQFTRKVTSK